MNKIKIVTDSSSDIPADLAEKFDIELIPLYVGYGHEMYKDNIQVDHDAIFKALLDGKKVNTAAPSPGDFYKVFEKILKDDKATCIICITLSSRLSGSYNSAITARKMLPYSDIRIIDSKTSTLSLGLIPIQAAMAVKKGHSLEETLELIETLIGLNRFLAVLGSFEYVFKGGRAAFFGNIFSKAFLLTPVLTIGRSGKVNLKKFSLNQDKALNYIADNALSIAKEYKRVNVGLFYGKDSEPIKEVKRLFESSKDISIDLLIENKITTVISAHTGPEIWGIAVSPVIV